MRPRTILFGTEAQTLEIGLSLDPDHACALAGPALEPLVEAGGARGDVLLFTMRGLHLYGLPRPRFDYTEALFRLAVHFGDDLAWLGLACDLDTGTMRRLGRWLVRYPVRPAVFELDAERFAVTAAEARLEVHATPTEDEPDAVPARPLLVRDGAHLYRIPWREEPAPWRRTATCRVVDDGLAQLTFGVPVRFEPLGLVHRGRIHHCGLANRVAAS
jgi:hypothetical protein